VSGGGAYVSGTDYRYFIAHKSSFPQGLKPALFDAPGGTAEAVPFPKPNQSHL
jgi:hypothetical protein